MTGREDPRGPGQPVVELLLAAQQVAAGHVDVVEDDLGGVRRADAVLLELLSLAEALVPGGITNDTCPRVPSVGSTVATTTCQSAMPPLVAHVFVPLMHPLVVGLEVDRPCLHRADVAARVRLRGAERAELGVVGRAVHGRDELADLLGGAVRADCGSGQTGAHQRQADPGVPQNSSSWAMTMPSPVSSNDCWAMKSSE